MITKAFPPFRLRSNPARITLSTALWIHLFQTRIITSKRRLCFQMRELLRIRGRSLVFRFTLLCFLIIIREWGWFEILLRYRKVVAIFVNSLRLFWKEMKLLYFSGYHCFYGMVRKKESKKQGKKSVDVSFEKWGKLAYPSVHENA